ncbi:MAG: hypothetical protein ACREH4_13365 [Vitreimonas sp.]
MFKKLLAGAAATAALMAPGLAAADDNAVVGFTYNAQEIESFDWDRYGINGAFSHDFSNGTLLQFDAAGERVDAGGCCLSTGYAAVHYGMRNDNHGFGGFLSLEDFGFVSGLGLGVEGQLHLTNVLINGSLGYVDFQDAELSGYAAQVDGAYFFTPNFAVTGLVSYTEGDEGIDADWTSYGVGGEWRFAGSPASVVFGYRHLDIEDSDGDTWTLGFNIDLGTDSLQDRSRSGPSFNGASALHNNLNVIPTGP